MGVSRLQSAKSCPEGHLNLIKLCVGVDSVDDLAARIAARGGETTSHTTRMRPKQAEAVLAGGSLYWVIRGAVAARQRIVALEDVRGADGIARCRIVLEAKLHRTQPATRRPFQGWRYLRPEDSPPDLPPSRESDSELPPELASALAELGLR